MFFSKTNRASFNPDIIVAGEKLRIVNQYKYLGLVIDSHLSFKAHIEKLCKIIKFNLANFRSIRNDMSTEAALIFLHSMIFSHLNYCFTSWSQASQSAKRPLETLYKQAIKIMDKKPRHYHHCAILKKHSLLNWNSIHKFLNLNLIYKVTHDLAPAPLAEFISQRNSSERVTRGFATGDCVIPLRRSVFSRSAWSVRGATEWNSIPEEVRQLNTYKAFTKKLKIWLINNYVCQH